MKNFKEKYPDWEDPCEHDWVDNTFLESRKVRIFALVVILLGFIVKLYLNK